jgi:hypothetical protein
MFMPWERGDAVIDSFMGEYRWLSNFQQCEVWLDDKPYMTTEAAYQAAKTLDEAEREAIRMAEKPGKAKKLGMKVKLRLDWEQVKLGVMEDLLRQKFSNDLLKAQLLATGTQELVEGNDWGDRFWGVCEGVGENHLGKILMKIRAELRLVRI